MDLTRRTSTRATVCVALAAAAALLVVAVPILGFLLAEDKPGGSHGQLVVQYLYGPYVRLVAMALAMFSIYFGLVRRYLVGSVEPRVRWGMLVSLAVLMYLAYAFSRAFWE